MVDPDLGALDKFVGCGKWSRPFGWLGLVKLNLQTGAKAFNAETAEAQRAAEKRRQPSLSSGAFI